MIGFLKGVVELKENGYFFLDVNGVGYKVLVTNELFSKSKVSDSIKIYTYTHVREDALDLFGFPTSDDLRLFELLLTVSGIGPKTALGIFSIGNYTDIIEAIAKGNVEFFEVVPRLGKKNAQKIIIDLKNKVGGIGSADLDLGSDSDDIVGALEAFGFSKKEAHLAIRELKGRGESAEEKIKLALKYLGK